MKQEENILIEMIVTNQCNKRCKYCDLNFKSQFQSEFNLIALSQLLSKSRDKLGEVTINFFGGEPLLGFTLIEKFISLNENIRDIGYSLGTNGILLDEKKFNFLSLHKVKLYFSIDTETYNHIFLKEYLLEYEHLTINFILNPNTIKKSFFIFEKLIKAGIKRFNIIPVYFTIEWSIDDLKQLKRFKLFVEKFSGIKGYFFSFYEEATSDKEFIFDTNGKFYKDIHTHFWFLKQYEIVPEDLKLEIEKNTFIKKIGDTSNINDLLIEHDSTALNVMSDAIVKKINMSKNMRLLHKIIKHEIF